MSDDCGSQDGDETSNGIYKPKDENTLSDFVKDHLTSDLKDRGIIANREVEIFRKTGGDPGEEIDIHVTTFSRDKKGNPRELLTCIIEVKGCWHKDVKNAMQTQLVDRYLKKTHNYYGIYLVGWYNCSQWDKADLTSKRYSNSDNKKEFHKMLETQAETLSSEGIIVKSYLLNTALR